MRRRIRGRRVSFLVRGTLPCGCRDRVCFVTKAEGDGLLTSEQTRVGVEAPLSCQVPRIFLLFRNRRVTRSAASTSTVQSRSGALCFARRATRPRLTGSARACGDRAGFPEEVWARWCATASGALTATSARSIGECRAVYRFVRGVVDSSFDRASNASSRDFCHGKTGARGGKRRCSGGG